MTFSRFQPHRPSLLSSHDRSSSSSSFYQAEQQPPPPTTRDLIHAPWHMIASSSSLWQDRKHSLTIKYSTPGDGGELHDVTSWYADNSDKQTSTNGISRPLAVESGYVYQWRGAGWLRMFTTKWEIVGLGVLSSPFHADGADKGERESNICDEGVVVLVTFVQKTIFSPQAISVFIQQESLDGEKEESVIKDVVAILRFLGMESLLNEIDKLKAIPRK
ncbi:hypothetical protein B7494_g443 [Chlorociboria aeruginascens]|nr:hypothetical protein B7494_g443 [Chlorociboria aeruginascens]